MNAIFQRFVREWLGWWNGLGLFQKTWPVAFVAAYLTVIWSLNGLRQDHFTMSLSLAALYYAGPRIRPVFNLITPFILVGMIYDSQRFYSHLIRSRIHVSEPYEIEKALFGIEMAGKILTPNEWLALHLNPVIDVITGFAYFVFVPQYMLVSAFFYFVVGAREPKWRPLLRAMPWSFLVLNIIGYITYHVYAATPPWYVSQYGFAYPPNDLAPSAAGCVRFDEIMGTSLFKDIYDKSPQVFGAIPSLHVSYPLLATLYAFRLKRLRAFCLGFYLTMCFAAVYLNHHYIIDVFVGSFYALLVGGAFISQHARHVEKKLEGRDVSDNPHQGECCPGRVA